MSWFISKSPDAFIFITVFSSSKDSLCPFFPFSANELDRSKWDEDWDKSRGAFPFSEKLGEISDKIGSTIDDTLNKFRKKERDDSPDRIRWTVCTLHNAWLNAGFRMDPGYTLELTHPFMVGLIVVVMTTADWLPFCLQKSHHMLPFRCFLASVSHLFAVL